MLNENTIKKLKKNIKICLFSCIVFFLICTNFTYCNTNEKKNNIQNDLDTINLTQSEINVLKKNNLFYSNDKLLAFYKNDSLINNNTINLICLETFFTYKANYWETYKAGIFRNNYLLNSIFYNLSFIIKPNNFTTYHLGLKYDVNNNKINVNNSYLTFSHKLIGEDDYFLIGKTNYIFKNSMFENSKTLHNYFDWSKKSSVIKYVSLNDINFNTSLTKYFFNKSIFEICLFSEEDGTFSIDNFGLFFANQFKNKNFNTEFLISFITNPGKINNTQAYSLIKIDNFDKFMNLKIRNNTREYTPYCAKHPKTPQCNKNIFIYTKSDFIMNFATKLNFNNDIYIGYNYNRIKNIQYEISNSYCINYSNIHKFNQIETGFKKGIFKFNFGGEYYTKDIDSIGAFFSKENINKQGYEGAIFNEYILYTNFYFNLTNNFLFNIKLHTTIHDDINVTNNLNKESYNNFSFKEIAINFNFKIGII